MLALRLLSIALVAALALGCRPTPKPITTGVDPSQSDASGKTFVGVEQPDDVIAMERPALPAATARASSIPQARVTVQYPPTSSQRPIGEISDQELAAEALARIGPPAVPALVQALQNSENDVEVRREAIRVLIRMGPDAAEAAPELTRRLDDPDETVRKLAAKALANIGPEAAVAVPALMRNLVPQP